MSKVKPVIGIYKITSPSGKVYIGQSWNIYRRIWAYRAGKCSKQIPLYYSITKYGWDNHKFEVIHELPPDVDQSILDNYEILYMQQYVECGITLLNVREGGSKGRPSKESIEKMVLSRREKNNYYHSENTIRKIAEANLGNKNALGNKSMLGKKHTDEARERISASRIGKPTFLGKKHTEEAKEKIAASKIGNKVWLGKTHTEETKAKIGAASKGRKHDEESLNKIKAASTGVNNPRSKLTEQQVREIKSKYVKGVYDSIKLAAEYGVSSGLIRGIVSGKVWSHIS